MSYFQPPTIKLSFVFINQSINLPLLNTDGSQRYGAAYGGSSTQRLNTHQLYANYFRVL